MIRLDDNMTLWVCRAGRNGEYENYFLDKKLIAITWTGLQCDLTKLTTKDQFKEALRDEYPECNKYQIGNFAGQLFPFVHSMKQGDRVILPSKFNSRIFYVGTINGDCKYTGDEVYTHTRSVSWDKKALDRSDIDSDIVHSLNSAQTIFSITADKEERLFSDRPKVKIKNGSDEDIPEELVSDMETTSMDQIKDLLIQRFKGYEMQEVVESIFKAKGYVTINTKGADKGIDVLASNGPLGFGGTKICIQVKTQESRIERNVFNELIGTMSTVEADYGLLVSWYGFKESLTSAKRDSFFKIRFWDGNDVLREFLENYDKLDDKIKKRIPLKKIWVVDNDICPE